MHDGWGPQNDRLVDWFLHVPSVLLFCPFLFGHFQRGVMPDGSNLFHVLVNHWLKKSTPPLPFMCRICWNGFLSFGFSFFRLHHLPSSRLIFLLVICFSSFHLSGFLSSCAFLGERLNLPSLSYYLLLDVLRSIYTT